MRDLSQELYNVISDAVVALGASRADQDAALGRAKIDRKRLRPSQTVLKNQLGVSALIAMWGRDPDFTRADGTPKVLPIHGKGATLESLVNRCVPQLPVEEVVKILCTQSDVTKMKGDKVALLGHAVNIIKTSPATSLAWMITQIRHLAETCAFNAAMPNNTKAIGRFERQVYGTLSKKQFDAWSQTVRQRLQETSARVEDDIGSHGPRLLRGKEKICGIGLFIFREDGNLG